jgi:hypothetical protein
MPPHKPLTNGANGHGRDDSGRFAAGNPGGPGNPHAQAVARFRAAIFDTVTEADFQKLVKSLLSKARGGNIAAARLVLEYCVGKPWTMPEPEPPPPKQFDAMKYVNVFIKFVPAELIPDFTKELRAIAIGEGEIEGEEDADG